MSPLIAFIIGSIFAIAGTVCAYIFVMPEKKRDSLPAFLQKVHDILNFKELYLEKVLRCLYVLSTLFCICGGFFMLFSGYSSFYSGFHSYALYGILLIILGPIVVRLSYESLMLFIILVKNTMSINNKLGGKKAEVSFEKETTPAPAPAVASAPAAPETSEENKAE